MTTNYPLLHSYSLSSLSLRSSCESMPKEMRSWWWNQKGRCQKQSVMFAELCTRCSIYSPFAKLCQVSKKFDMSIAGQDYAQSVEFKWLQHRSHKYIDWILWESDFLECKISWENYMNSVSSNACCTISISLFGTAGMSMGELGCILQPSRVSAANIILRQSLHFLKKLDGVVVKTAHKLMDLVSNADCSSKVLNAGLCF